MEEGHCLIYLGPYLLVSSLSYRTEKVLDKYLDNEPASLVNPT